MTKTSFKKLTGIVLAFMMLISVFAVSVSAFDTGANSAGSGAVYLDASGKDQNSGFSDYGAVFYAYTWENGENWISGTPEGNYIRFDGLSSGEGVIFVRCDPNGSAGWSSKWNQTANLTVDNTLFTLTSWEVGPEKNLGGVWSAYQGAGTNPSTPSGVNLVTEKYAVVVYDAVLKKDIGEFYMENGVCEHTFDNNSYIFIRNVGSNKEYCLGSSSDVFANPATFYEYGTPQADSEFPKMSIGEGTHTLMLVDNGNNSYSLYIDQDPSGGETDPTQASEETQDSQTTDPTQGSQETQGSQTTDPTQGSQTTQSTQQTQSGGKLTVSVKINGNEVKTVEEVTGETLTISFPLTAPALITDGDLALSYDSAKFTMTDVSLPNITSGSKATSPSLSVNPYYINFTGVNESTRSGLYDFKNGAVLVKAVFSVKSGASGLADINLTIRELDGLENDLSVPYFSNSQAEASADALLSSLIPSIEQPGATENTQQTQSTEPTSPTSSVTVVSISAAKTKIYVGKTTTVSASVTNKKGQTKYTTSNSKVATVDSVTGVVTGKSQGTAYIKATNGDASDSVKITVIRRANTLKVSAKKLTVKVKSKKTVFARTKAFKISGAKGKLSFKKKSGSKLVSINKKTGKITVKNGLKKGKTYTIRFNVRAAGDRTYKAKSKNVSVKIKVK